MTNEAAQRGKFTAAIAPVIAPATGPITVKKELDDKQVLHVEICVDGKCYRSSMDLAPAIQMVMAKLAQWHQSMHATMPNGGVSPTVVVGAVENAIGAAGDAMADMLVDRHRTVAVSGFLDDIGNFVKGIPVVGDVFKGAGETVKALSGPLKAAAPLVATAFGGPAAGAAASQFAGSIIDSLAGGKDTPQKAAAEQQAKTDPVVAQQLASTKDALAHTIAAFHTTETARKAAHGHPTAQQHVDQLVADAERGDPVAHAVIPLVAQGFRTAQAERRQGPPGSYRQVASSAVVREQQRYRQRHGRPAAAFVFLREGQKHKAIGFPTLQAAQAHYLSLPSAPGAYSYAALYDARDLATPIADSFGGPPALSTVSGGWPWQGALW